MIGQTYLKERLQNLIQERTFPRFSILVGPKGSGKKTLANWIITKIVRQEALSYSQVCPDVKIDTIRQIIENAYKTISTNIYVIPDADEMSNAAKNALLKVTEEPPNNAYFIMTLEDENNTLETIRSRGTVFHMDRYTPDEILEYCGDNHFNEDDENYEKKENIVKELCETPGDVEILWDSNPLEFYDYVQLVVNNIETVSLANAFKISSKIALKDDDKGYDLNLFWRVFQKICLEIATTVKEPEIIMKYGTWSITTAKFARKLRSKGINKQMLFDNWILSFWR